MLNVIFTLDYEIHGNGDGSPHELMVEPTSRMLDLFDRHGAKLTILADVAEILKFREYKEEHGRDDYDSDAIMGQLRNAVARGHDVQLHLHCSYFNARFQNGKWEQDWTEYNFAGLDEKRIDEVLRMGKAFLEEQLRPVDPSYRCYVFRAANWAVSPSAHIVRSLVRNGFEIDTSVFKYGRRNGVVSFDYANAPSNLIPWFVSEEDICRRDDAGELVEFPIYCERTGIAGFVSLNRLYRAWLSRRHSFGNGAVPAAPSTHDTSSRPNRVSRLFDLVFGKHPRKADFNQCSGRQLIHTLARVECCYRSTSKPLPFVLIGHSKLFTRQNERSLTPFLRYVASRSDRYRFARFRDCERPDRHVDFAGLTASAP
jgi:hypothetical protein